MSRRTNNSHEKGTETNLAPRAHLSRRTFIAGATLAGVNMAIFGLSGCAPKGDDPKASEGLSFKAGTYTGEGEGKFGKLTLETTFSDTALVDIKIGEHDETARVSDPAFDNIPDQIIKMQALGIDTITGCTLTCAGILTAVEDCVKQANGDVKAMKKNYTAPELSNEVVDMEVDIVIAGAGGAGIGAANAAAKNGAKKILVLEKNNNIGGNVLVSGGALEHLAAPAELRPPMTPELTNEFNKEMSNELVAKIDPVYVDKIKADYEAYLASGDTTVFDSVELMALQEFLLVGDFYEGGLQFAKDIVAFDAYLDENGFKWRPNQGIIGYPWPRWSAPVDGICGQGYFDFFDDLAQKNNYPIEILLDTPATELIKEGNKVVGLKAVAKDGTTYNIKSTHGVLLTTGGFAGNPEMLREYNEFWPWDDKTVIPTTNTNGHDGDGIKMALGEGAKLEAMELLMMFPLADTINGADDTSIGGVLFVNAEGKRFVDETLDRYSISKAIMEQTDQIEWSISDKESCGINEKGLNWGHHPVQRSIDNGTILKADTLEDLAKQIGCDPATFKATVDNFNKMVRSGVDPDFGRMIFDEGDLVETPPFYACKRTWSSHITEGGVVIDEKYRIIREDGSPIEGLHAAGELTAYNSGVSCMALGFNAAQSMMTA